MPTIGLPTLLTTQKLQSFVTSTKKALDDARVEAVTGQAADRSKALGGAIDKIRRLEKSIADNQQRSTAASLFLNDATIVQETLTSGRSAAGDLRTRVDSALGVSDNTALRAIADDAYGELSSLVGQLNSPFAGRYLFSGADTTTPPLDSASALVTTVQGLIEDATTTTGALAAIDAYFNDADGGFQTEFFNGSTTDAPDRELGQGRRLGVSERPTDAGLRDVIKGLAMLAATRDATASDEVVEGVRAGASARLGVGAEEILTRQTELGAYEAEATNIKANLEAARFTYEQALADLTAVDEYEAASRMQLYMTQLEAAYLTSSQISRMSMVNYY